MSFSSLLKLFKYSIKHFKPNHHHRQNAAVSAEEEEAGDTCVSDHTSTRTVRRSQPGQTARDQ